MKRSIFKNTGQWYKGNLHSHTTLSDGNLSPVEAKELYKKLGYQFISFTDHDLYYDHRKELDDEQFITLPGMELSASLRSEDDKVTLKTHHLNGFLGTVEMQNNKRNVPIEGKYLTPRKFIGKWDGKQVAQEMCDQLCDYGMFVMMNHPVWSRVDEVEFIDTKNIWGLEIYNYGTELESNTGFDSLHWDVSLRRGATLFATATDDNHNNPSLPDSGGGYVMVQSEALTHESIIQNLLEGNFYSSSGPSLFDFGVDEGCLYVECSNVKEIRFIVGNRVGDGRTVHAGESETICHATYPLRGHEEFGRVECVDETGRIAWSNSIKLKG